MEKFISDFYGEDEVKIITPNDGYSYFFAYYDMRATGKNGKHLTHRVNFDDRLQTADDVCELGYLDDGKFYKFAETTAWNFQQGAMLQYHPFKENTVYYNAVKDGKFVTVTHNYVTGEKSYTDRATACISPDGKWGLAINFGRIFDFRPGYGYAGYVDENKDVNAPDNDGIFLVDMESGKSKLLYSYVDLYEENGFKKEDKILVNHITFNTNSKKFVALVRSFPKANSDWATSMVVGDLEGNFHTVIKTGFVSHYYWVDDEHIMAFCSMESVERNLYVIDVRDSSFVKYNMEYFDVKGKAESESNRDIHCSTAPDGNYVIGDGYPLENNKYRYMMAYNVKTKEARVLFKEFTVMPSNWDIRCDLHARFVWDGKYISYDTTQNGKRQIALISADKLNF